MGSRIYLGNLPFRASEAELVKLLQDLAVTVLEVKLVHDRKTGRPLGFGFAEVSTDDEAALVVERLRGADFGGRPLRVELAAPEERAGRSRRPRS